mmetsp:Transcript_9903/g.23892  ORF Transcript_9903/g.23892 Transcript_9903/m.23892 type:complete len:289 (-) Transcript_9903:7-873(-)
MAKFVTAYNLYNFYNTSRNSPRMLPILRYFSNSLPVLRQNIFRDLQPPVKQSLSDHGTDLGVGHSAHASGRINLVAELRSKSSLWTRALEPPADLSLVVGASPPLIKAAIPLEPSVRIRIADPPRGFPHTEAPSALDAELVDKDVILGGSQHGGCVQSLDPFWSYRIAQDVRSLVANVGHGRNDGTIVGSTKRSGPQNFFRGTVRLEILQHGGDALVLSGNKRDFSRGFVPFRQRTNPFFFDGNGSRRQGGRILVDFFLLGFQSRLIGGDRPGESGFGSFLNDRFLLF